jgi:hypothetical protein
MFVITFCILLLASNIPDKENTKYPIGDFDSNGCYKYVHNLKN